MDSQFLKTISIIADFVTLTTVFTAIPFALLRKNKSILAFRVGNFLHYLFRSALILVLSILIFKISELIYFFLLLPFKEKVEDNNYVWENGKQIHHIVAYFISGTVGLSLFWLMSSTVWTSSLNTAKEFLNLFLPKNKIFLKQEPPLEILNATYKTTSAEVDVTQVVRQRVSNNKLIIIANNDLAGDPHPGVPKTLKLNYRVGNKSFSIQANEGDTVIIPEIGS
ncbi:MAG: hypothetical protein C0446_13005 [Chitinophaga sp.]|nr:hypothetical protein [Chitinophaga sp.]